MQGKRLFYVTMVVVLSVGLIGCGSKTQQVQQPEAGQVEATIQPTNDDQNTASLAHVQPGDEIAFGNYGGKDIDWFVLDVDDNRAYLVSKRVIALLPFGDGGWEESTVRAWLNNDFIDSAFSEAENKIICESVVTILSGSSGNSYEVNDRVFIPYTHDISEFKTEYTTGDNIARPWHDFIPGFTEEGVKEAAGILVERGSNQTYEEAITWYLEGNAGISYYYMFINGYDYNAHGQRPLGVYVDQGDDYRIDFITNSSIVCGVRPAMWIAI